jgi:hypothetical protein
VTRRPLDDRIRELNWPEPSGGLRDRVLADAEVVAVRITWSDRVWFSRAWRAAGFVVTVGVSVAAIWSGGGERDRGTYVAQSQTERLAENIVREAGFRPDLARAIARRAQSELAPPAGLADQQAVLDAIAGGH